MQFRELCFLMEQKGFYAVGRSFYGTIGDFAVTARLSKGFCGHSVRFSFTLYPEQVKPTLKRLRRALRGKGSCRSGRCYLFVSLPADEQRFSSLYDDACDILLHVFSGLGVRPVRECPLCGRAGCDSLAHIGKGYLRVHEGCLKSSRCGAQIIPLQSGQGSSYALGALGGILGGVAGCIPSILSLWLAETVYLPLYAFIPFCVYGGYALFCGKRGKAAFASVCVLSAIFAVAVNLAVVGVTLVNTGRALRELPLLFQYKGFVDSFLMDTLKSILFAAFGSAILWSVITRGGQTASAKAQDSLTTLSPADSPHPVSEKETAAPSGVRQSS